MKIKIENEIRRKYAVNSDLKKIFLFCALRFYVAKATSNS